MLDCAYYIRKNQCFAFDLESSSGKIQTKAMVALVASLFLQFCSVQERLEFMHPQAAK